MCTAWETTREDIENVLDRNGITPSLFEVQSSYELYVDNCSDTLCEGSIVSAALHGDDMEEQTELAYTEIETQLRDSNLIDIKSEDEDEDEDSSKYQVGDKIELHSGTQLEIVTAEAGDFDNVFKNVLVDRYTGKFLCGNRKIMIGCFYNRDIKCKIN